MLYCPLYCSNSVLPPTNIYCSDIQWFVHFTQDHNNFSNVADLEDLFSKIVIYGVLRK